jgi:hypothetical protein
MIQSILPLALSFFALISCISSEKESSHNSTASKELSKKIQKESLPAGLSFSWLDMSKYSAENALVNQVALPTGFKREDVANGSFAEWLRFLPLMATDQKVMLFDGREKPYQAGAHRVINIDIGKSDLQQCADAIMRLKAEYHYSRGEFDKIHFNFTSGHKVSFDDWRKGRKPVVSGNNVSFTNPTAAPDNSYQNFQKYLRMVFMYAGTASLEKELKTGDLQKIKAGDLFIKGGFPGHAVLVIDVAENLKSGEKIFLLAQSYMPAQSIHILKNFKHNSGQSPWYPQNFGEILYTPEWDFKAASFKIW